MAEAFVAGAQLMNRAAPKLRRASLKHTNLFCQLWLKFTKVERSQSYPVLQII